MPFRFQKVEASGIPRESAHKGGKVVSPTPAAFTPQETSMVLISVRECVDPTKIVQPEGIEHATYWPVEHCLNQLSATGPLSQVLLLMNHNN
jgi:hypothetical protein